MKEDKLNLASLASTLNGCNSTLVTKIPVVLFRDSLPDMATSSTTLKATAKGMSKVPVLPPIEGTQLRDEVRQTADTKEEIAKTTSVQKRLLRQRRSAVQRKQLQTLLYVFS